MLSTFISNISFDETNVCSIWCIWFILGTLASISYSPLSLFQEPGGTNSKSLAGEVLLHFFQPRLDYPAAYLTSHLDASKHNWGWGKTKQNWPTNKLLNLGPILCISRTVHWMLKSNSGSLLAPLFSKYFNQPQQSSCHFPNMFRRWVLLTTLIPFPTPCPTSQGPSKNTNQDPLLIPFFCFCLSGLTTKGWTTYTFTILFQQSYF
jgi:hypothetical protein